MPHGGNFFFLFHRNPYNTCALKLEVQNNNARVAQLDRAGAF